MARLPAHEAPAVGHDPPVAGTGGVRAGRAGCGQGRAGPIRVSPGKGGIHTDFVLRFSIPDATGTTGER